jgi:hypothetical protein
MSHALLRLFVPCFSQSLLHALEKFAKSDLHGRRTRRALAAVVAANR